MHSIEEFKEIINTSIAELDLNLSPDNIIDPVRYTLKIGGKRLRPSLTLMACELFSGKYEAALPAALAIETFHNSTLIHDDIMDNADIRRSQPTVYKKWNSNIAILSGDVMILKAYDLLAKSEPKILPELLTTFNKVAIEVCEGQQYDLDYENNNEVSISDYMNMIKLKTSVLIAGALKLGAIVGGANNKNADYLYKFGENLGLAFQLQDDILDSFGDTNTFGKAIGGDIVANKKTYLLIKALEIAKGPYHDELTSLIANEKIDKDEKISKVINIYETLEIKQNAEDFMIKYFETALSYLDKIDIDTEKKIALNNVAKKLMGRKY